jgi:hypothetical protein
MLQSKFVEKQGNKPLDLSNKFLLFNCFQNRGGLNKGLRNASVEKPYRWGRRD